MSGEEAHFLYPSAGELLCAVLTALGYGGDNWPTGALSPATYKRIAGGEFRQYYSKDFERFLLEAVGLMFSTSVADRARVREALRPEKLHALFTGYDRARSQLNSRALPARASTLHALPALALAARLIGIASGAAMVTLGHKPGDEAERFARLLLFNPGSFPALVEKYFERATPGMSWLMRAQAAGINKDTLARLRKKSPGERFKFMSVEKVARFLGERLDDESAMQIEMRLRWSAACERLRGRLDRFLGTDAEGRPWVEHLVELMARFGGASLRVLTSDELLRADLSPESWTSANREEMLNYWRAVLTQTDGQEAVSEWTEEQILARVADLRRAYESGDESHAKIAALRSLLGVFLLLSPHSRFGLAQVLGPLVEPLSIAPGALVRSLGNLHQQLEPAIRDVDHRGDDFDAICTTHVVALSLIGMPIPKSMHSIALRHSFERFQAGCAGPAEVNAKFQQLFQLMPHFENLLAVSRGHAPNQPLPEPETDVERAFDHLIKMQQLVNTPGTLSEKLEGAGQRMIEAPQELAPRLIYATIVYELAHTWLFSAWKRRMIANALGLPVDLENFEEQIEGVTESLEAVANLVASASTPEDEWRADRVLLVGGGNLARLQFFLVHHEPCGAEEHERAFAREELVELADELKEFCAENPGVGDALDLLALIHCDLGDRKAARRYAKEARHHGCTRALKVLDGDRGEPSP